jgi:hypothetical protein
MGNSLGQSSRVNRKSSGLHSAVGCGEGGLTPNSPTGTTRDTRTLSGLMHH